MSISLRSSFPPQDVGFMQGSDGTCNSLFCFQLRARCSQIYEHKLLAFFPVADSSTPSNEPSIGPAFSECGGIRRLLHLRPDFKQSVVNGVRKMPCHDTLSINPRQTTKGWLLSTFQKSRSVVRQRLGSNKCVRCLVHIVGPVFFLFLFFFLLRILRRGRRIVISALRSTGAASRATPQISGRQAAIFFRIQAPLVRLSLGILIHLLRKATGNGNDSFRHLQSS